jgi:hypothetical protein
VYAAQLQSQPVQVTGLRRKQHAARHHADNEHRKYHARQSAVLCCYNAAHLPGQKLRVPPVHGRNLPSR